ncbi:MAG: T9SS type A sorting domain-containing protein [Candidatus Cloacimonetes bacterium]|nr:T9SS type A sorting domain-containing protein [Candidatus Cloacimonadota bacterium]
MKKSCVFLVMLLILALPLLGRRNIMMTGYWAPTSEMIYLFSNDPELNPDGWIGENWEDLGFDVYAYFPAFNRVTRDFEVDYQATWEDFWATVAIINPIAIISYGAGSGPWEIEYNSRNLAVWVNDYEYPFQPTPCPPDSMEAANFVRHATLPVSEIELAVDEQTPLNAWVDWNGNPGGFLCEYMAYLGMWYQGIHSSFEDEYPCLAAGFIHVNAGVNLGYATTAAEVTLRTTIEYLNNYVDLTGTVYAGGVDPGGAVISLENEIAHYTAIADHDGNFSFPLLPAGTYEVIAFLDRYYYYEGEALVDAEHTELEITLEEFASNPPLTWCAEATELVTSAPGMNIVIAGVFDDNDLMPYVNCHLRELSFTAPADPEDCNIDLILYEGMPDDGNPMLILLETELTDFVAGEGYNYWINNLALMSEATWENGLTLALQITGSNGNVGWMDAGPAVSGKGNMIKVSGTWMEAYDMLGVDGNWDLRLGFYGTPITETDNDIITLNNRLYNYPNPFNPETRISFLAPESSSAQIAIYNVKGELVKEAEMKPDPSGRFSWLWEGINEQGNPVASGIYLARVKTQDLTRQCKMLLIK